MPVKPLRPCAYQGCPNLIREGRFCAEHTQLTRGQYDRERGSSASRGYGARWRKLRAMKLGADPICADPYRRHVGQVVPAVHVDHIIPRAQGGTDAWENLQSLCGSCHSYKTVTQDGGWGREVQIPTASDKETARGVSNMRPQVGSRGEA